MSKFTRKLISPIEPVANASGIYSAVEQLQNLNALAITAVNFCADSSGTANGLNDDTAISTAGGFVKLTGSGFTSASIVYINGISVTKYYLSNTTIVATVPAAVAGTTASLIVFNGSTVGSIWAAGISYSGFPSWTTTVASNNGLVVNTQLIAAGDAPLTYTFVSGTLPPNCTISSSGLLSGTVTGVSTNAIYTFTVAVTDAQNQNVSQSIVYTLVVSDFYYRYTSLHISGDSTPTWITDASTNALAITTAGAPQATTFSPLEAGYYGNSFNGSSDYLTLPSTAGLAMGTGDFTIELWYYPLSGTNNGIFQVSTASGGFLASYINTIALYMYNNNVGVYANGTATYGGNNKLLYNVWTHIALVRISGVTKVYINGVLDTSFASGGLADTTNYTGTYGVIGGYYSTGYLSNAYISNFRIVKGTAVYTANFTPSATPLTAITNTSLLTCQSNRFIDNSAVPATITVAGTPKVVSSNPFNLPAGLAAYGAGYFNGSTDYLSVPASSTWAFGTGDFTIEVWAYIPNFTNRGVFLSNRATASSSTDWTLQWYASKVYFGTATTDLIIGSNNLIANTWNHIVVSRGSGTLRLFVNGISDATAVTGNATNFSSVQRLCIGNQDTGSGYSYYYTGYLSNARIVNGTAVYTTAFTPPTIPLTAVTGTSLLTLQTNVPHNNSQFRDTSPNNALITRYGNTTQGSFSPFTKQYPYSSATVGGSAYFDGTGDYLTVPSTTAFTVPASGSFTIEAWVNLNSLGADRVVFSSGIGNGLSDMYFGITSSNTIDFIAPSTSGATGYYAYGTTALAASTWYHIAATRVGGTVRLFLNGIQETITQYQSGNSANQFGTTGPAYIGSYFNTFSWFAGYISNLRFVNGTALYTSNFTPSTTPLTAIPGTVLLMPFTNAAVYDNTMLNNFETGGNVQVNTSTFKYGTGALRTGSGNYLLTPMKDSYQFGSGDFTVETWAYIVNNVSSATLIDCAGSGGNYGWFLEYSAARGLFFYMGTGSSGSGATYNTTPALSTWTHLAVARQSGTVRMFINGALVNTTSLPNSSVATLPLAIGAANNYTTTYYLDGYMDEVRITKGYARYTATFTPATGAYSASAPFGTSTLPSKSLRFRSSASAYLSRTPAVAGNRTTWTMSMWVKRGTLGVDNNNLMSLQSSGASQNYLTFTVRFLSTDNLRVVATGAVGAGDLNLDTTQVFRDPAAWYHIVLVMDTTQATAANRVLLYINGSKITSFSSATYPTQNYQPYWNNNQALYLGYFPGGPTYFDGEMAEVNFVDGLALGPTMFGAYSTYGQWLPISYAGYQGANGFYLPFNVDTLSVNYLVVAGGGSGGGAYGGGGGAGGLLSGSSLAIAPGSAITVTVGAGGAATGTGVNQGNNGSNSVLGSLTAIAGGGGGSNGVAGKTGGSAGGSSYNTYSATAGTAGQGNAGGYAPFTDTATNGNASAGGGGAGAVGSNAPGSSNVDNGGNGGIGLQSSISGTSAYYAGGGGGGSGGYNVTHTATSGGLGGGAGGGVWNSGSGTSATANTGGGGGGGSGGAPGGGGGAGGSGIVIISYTGAQKLIGGTVTSVGGNTIHTFTASGTLINAIADSSGNANNWTPNNINVSTPGPTYDLLTDVPTLTSATAANYAIINAINPKGGSTVSNGNLTEYITGITGGRGSNIAMTSGKFYCEVLIVSSNSPAGGGYTVADVGITSPSAASYILESSPSAVCYYSYNGTKYVSGTPSAYGTAWSAIGTYTIGMALDVDAGTLQFYLNNVGQGNITLPTKPSDGWIFIADWESSGGSAVYNWNFGQQPWTYTPPANFLALNTYNI